MHHRRTRGAKAVVLFLVLFSLAGLATMAVARLGLHPYVVRTGSMAPTANPGDVVLDSGDVGRIRRGDVITFSLGPAGLVTHRVQQVGETLRTKGDANRTADPWTLAPAQVVGRVQHVVPRLGYVLVYLQQPTGIASLVTTVLGLLLAWQIFFGSPAAPRHAQPVPARSLVAGAAAGASLLLLAAVAVPCLIATGAPRTGAWFTDSRTGAFTLPLEPTCDDTHDHGNGPGNGAGHESCRGNGHHKEARTQQ